MTTHSRTSLNYSTLSTRVGRRAIGSALRNVRADIACIVFLCALCLAFFWRLVTPDASARMLVATGDFTNQFFPYRSFLASQLFAGRLPLWNPFILGGHPFSADPQTSTAYPLGVIATYVLGAGRSTLLSLEWRSIIHYFLAAAFTYLFAKELTGNKFGSSVAAIAFAFSGYMQSYPGEQVPILETAIWLPLILLFIHRSARSDQRWFLELSFAGAAFGIAVLAGHPQTAMFLFYASLLYLLYLAWAARWAWKKIAIGLVCFVFVGLGLSAVQTFQAIEFMSLSSRAQLSYEVASHGYGFSSMLGVFMPNWHNEKALYVGVAPLVLALHAVTRRTKGGGFWTFLAGGSLILSLGGKAPLFPLMFQIVPGFSLFKDQERIVLLFAFAVSILAAHGSSLLIDANRASSRSRALHFILPFVVVGAGALVPFTLSEWSSSTSFQPGLYGGVFSGYDLFIALAIGTLALVLTGNRARTFKSISTWRALLLALVVGDLFLFNWNNNVSPTYSLLSNDAVSTLDFLKAQPGVFRVRAEDDKVFPANYPAMFGLAHVGGDTPIRNKRIGDLLDSGWEWRIWQLFNVEYVVTRKKLTEGVETVFQSGDLTTYKVIYGLPRAYAVPRFRVAATASEALELTLSHEIHPGDTVVLEEKPSFVTSSSSKQRPEVDIVEYSPQRLVMQASAEDDAMLVVSDTYYPGWKAYVDRTPTKIYRANYAFRAIELPRGRHVIEMVYEPASFRIGAVVSLLVLAGLVVLAIRSYR